MRVISIVPPGEGDVNQVGEFPSPVGPGMSQVTSGDGLVPLLIVHPELLEQDFGSILLMKYLLTKYFRN